MEEIQKILVDVDAKADTSVALDRAVELARHAEASLELIDVVSELPVYLRVPTYGHPALSDTLVAEAREALERKAASLRSQGVQASATALYGKPFLEIVRESMRGDFDLVVTDDHHDKMTAMRLFRACPKPVWAVKSSNCTGKPCKVLAAVDTMSGYDEENLLNRRILHFARTFARLDEAELHVLQAWGPGVESKELLTPYLETLQSDAQGCLDEFIQKHDGSVRGENVHLIEGEPAQAIQDFVRRHEIDVVVMGTLVRTGVAGLLIGNTAERVLSDIECSVAAVKPPGFQSPVELE